MKKITASLLFLLAFLLLSPPAGAQNNAGRIIGGEPTTVKEYPWMVALVDKKIPSSYWGQFCGGTLIHPRWVLTAAHCLVGGDGPWGYDVVVGRSNLKKKEGQRIAAWSQDVSPDYNSSWTWSGHDIGLVYLGKRAGVQPLPFAKSRPADGSTLEIAGWGATRARYPERLQAAEINLISDTYCSAENSYGGIDAGNVPAYRPEDGMLCAGREDSSADSCWGDSGGPLLQRSPEGTALIGAVSMGMGCAEPGYPGIYAATYAGSADAAWVQETISKTPDWINKFRPGKDQPSKTPQPASAIGVWRTVIAQPDERGKYLYEPQLFTNRSIAPGTGRMTLTARDGKTDPFCVDDVCYRPGKWTPLEDTPGRRAFFSSVYTNLRCVTVHIKWRWLGQKDFINVQPDCSNRSRSRTASGLQLSSALRQRG